MTIIPSIVSALFSILLWLYMRHNLKRNFVNLFQIGHLWLYVFDFIFVFCAFFRFIYRIQNSYLNNSAFYFLINLSYVLLGFLGLITLVFILLDLKHTFDNFFKRSPPALADLGRREFFKKNLAITGIATSTMIAGAGYANSFDPQVSTIHIPLSEAHKNLNGLKIVQLSDIHIGPTLKKEFCEMLVTKVNALKPDLIAITGDMVDGRVAYLKDELLPFLNFQSRLGTYFITGNHEYYWYANEWVAWARSSGMTPLMNENVKLSHNNTDFFLAGVTDPSSNRLDKKNASDPKKAVLGIPTEAYKILLAHQPNACFRACKAGFHTQLSGHTHGGQGFPWNIIVTLLQPYVRGLNKHEGMNVYVHSGTGFWGPPNRFMVNSEIAEIIFTSTGTKV
ncbi:MAG: metallophosphoesterase [Bacteriovorax sp.]|nr:metallophosphoesterase [Bacteriovorax sp.]